MGCVALFRHAFVAPCSGVHLICLVQACMLALFRHVHVLHFSGMRLALLFLMPCSGICSRALHCSCVHCVLCLVQACTRSAFARHFSILHCFTLFTHTFEHPKLHQEVTRSVFARWFLWDILLGRHHWHLDCDTVDHLRCCGHADIGNFRVDRAPEQRQP